LQIKILLNFVKSTRVKLSELFIRSGTLYSQKLFLFIFATCANAFGTSMFFLKIDRDWKLIYQRSSIWKYFSSVLNVSLDYGIYSICDDVAKAICKRNDKLSHNVCAFQVFSSKHFLN